MRWGALGVVLGLPLGAAVGLVGYYVIFNVDLRLDARKRPEDTVLVVVIARDVPAGEPITDLDVYAVQIPPRYLPDGVLLAPERVVGTRAAEDLFANELARAERLEAR